LDSFTGKKYVDNIFQNKLEESLVLIQKHQKNILRSREKENKTGETSDEIWKESDLFTADGCCYALALFLFNKSQAEIQS